MTIKIAEIRYLNFSGVAADVVHDLITLDKTGGAIKMALCIHNITGSRITFTNPKWAGMWGSKYGDFFRKKGINIGPSTPRAKFVGIHDNVRMNEQSVPSSLPGAYEEYYTDEVQAYRRDFTKGR